MNLLLLIGAPLLTALAVLAARNRQQVKWISLTGSLIQLGLAVALLLAYRHERALQHTAQMLFEQQYPLFKSFNIGFHIGVDGISVAMILLTSFVVVAGVRFLERGKNDQGVLFPPAFTRPGRLWFLYLT